MTFDEAFTNLQDCYDGIVAAITQIPQGVVRGGRVASLTAASKLGGIASTTAAMGTASAVGTAGTGASISGLYGAAATNAQIAWLGGGSMAVGGPVLICLAVVGGYAGNRVLRNTVLGKARTTSDFDMVESAVLVACEALGRALPGSGERVSLREVEIYARDGVWPLVRELDAHRPVLRRHLSPVSRTLLDAHWWKLASLACALHPEALDAVVAQARRGGGAGSSLHDLVDVGAPDFSRADLKAAIAARASGAHALKAKAWAESVSARTVELGTHTRDKAREALESLDGAAAASLETLGGQHRGAREGMNGTGGTLTGMAKAVVVLDAAETLADTLQPLAAGLSGRLAEMGRWAATRSTEVARSGATWTDAKLDGIRDRKALRRDRSTLVLAVTVQRLAGDLHARLSWQEDLALDALRLAVPELASASQAEVGRYLRATSPGQRVGLLSATKGKFHELVFAQAHNEGEDASTARLHERANHPGADIEFVVDGEVVSELQLKAVGSPAAVREHLSRYPDIDVRVTEEVAALMEGVESSGFANADLHARVDGRMRDMKGEGAADQVVDALATSALARSGQFAWLALRGTNPVEVRRMLDDAATATVTAVVLDAALEGGLEAPLEAAMDAARG